MTQLNQFNESFPLHTIRQWDLFWECEGGRDAAFVAIENPTRQKQITTLHAIDLATGDRQDFGQHDQAGPYGVRLYRLPQYTKPDWPALAASMAKALGHVSVVVIDQTQKELDKIRAQANEIVHAHNAMAYQLDAANRKISALNKIIDQVDGIISKPENGITLARRIRAVLERHWAPSA